MKKSIIYLLSASLLVAATGCLKDKGFEDQEYGIQVKEIKGVSFPQASSSPVIVGVDRQSTPLTVDGPFLTLEQSGSAANDVRIKLQLDNNLVTAEGLTPLPAGSFNLSTLEVTIPKGERSSDDVTITFPNVRASLDPNIRYGLGFRIVEADQGYTIAGNARTIVIGVVVNNPYAGEYTVTGYFFHPTAPRTLNVVKELNTVSPTVVRADHSDLYTSDYLFDFSVEDGTNRLINYIARGSTPAGAQSGFMTADVPFTSTAPTPPGTAPWVHATYNNTYDPATRTFWMHYGYAVGAASQTQYTRQVYERWVRN